MEEKIIQKLKTLSGIKPDLGFAIRTKLDVLNAPLKKPFVFALWPYLGFASALAVISAYLTLSSIADKNKLREAFDSNSINAELKDFPISIELARVEYFEDLEKTISLALREIKTDDGNTEEIEKLLEKLL